MLPHSRTAVTLVTACVIGLGALAAGPAQGESARPCNLYYPLPAGGTWTYYEGPLDGKPRVEKLVVVKSVEGTTARRTAIVEQSVRTPGAPGVAAGQAQSTVHCDNGRIGMTVQGVAQGREGGRTSSGTVTAEIPGIAPAAKLVAGYRWKSKSLIKATDDELRSVTEGHRENRVVGFEPVTVPAGRFDRALKIESVETLQQQGQGRTARQELLEWYVANVGLVKRETRVRSGNNAATSVEVLVKSSLLSATR
ncbi:MAG: hypothetical protein P8R42_25440 [Candidatus Binatia bacterium]|nr:hypothetical protein [Candidatus Binatia bacterium]